MHQKINNLYQKHQQILHYFIMAGVIVTIEFLSYTFMLWLGMNYLIAVPFSMAIGIFLNWIGCRVFIFKKGRHAPSKEFILVLIVSLIGVGFQLVVVYVVASLLGLSPILGKAIAIVVTFFWNYWARKRYIFND